MTLEASKVARTNRWFGRLFYSVILRLVVIPTLLVAVGCASVPLPPPGSVAHTPNEAILNQIWDATYTHSLFESLPLKMPVEEMISDRFKNTNAQYQAKIQTLLDQCMDPQKLQMMLKSQLLVKFRGTHANKLIKFYLSPLGKFYGEAGHQFDPEDPQFKTFIEGPKPQIKRLEQLTRLLSASGSAKFASLTLVTPIETIFQELEHQKKLSGRKSHGNPNNNLKKSMSSVVRAMHKAMLLTSSFVYRSLNPKEMEQLIQFETSPAAKWYNAAILNAYERTLQISMRRFTKGLLRLLQESPPG